MQREALYTIEEKYDLDGGDLYMYVMFAVD